MRFSVAPSNFRESVTLLVYEPVAGLPGIWTLVSVSWSEGCRKSVKVATILETPVEITYPDFPEFAHWRKAGCSVNTIEDSPTFERFWNAYGYKVGNKSRVQKKWNQLPEGERVLAMAAIPRYKRFAQSKRIDLVYPETYIDQRRWENEYTNN